MSRGAKFSGSLCREIFLPTRREKKPDGIDNILKLDTKISFLKITLLSGQACQGSNSETLHTSLGCESEAARASGGAPRGPQLPAPTPACVPAGPLKGLAWRP